MMQGFPIFKKSNKFYWSNNSIVFAIVIPCASILLIRTKVINAELGTFDRIITIIMGGAFILGIILKFIRFTKPDPLRGTLEGYIIFLENKIIANDETFELHDIKSIRINNADYYGRIVGSGRDFNSHMSNGVDNVVELELINGVKHSYNFEQYNLEDLHKFKEQLIVYYKLGKLGFLNLIDILQIKDYDEIQEFKRKIA